MNCGLGWYCKWSVE